MHVQQSLLRVNRYLAVDVLLKIIKFVVTMMKISIYFSWALDP